MTRRSTLSLIGSAVVLPASVFGELPGNVAGNSPMISDSACQWVKENTREYRPDGGMLGRGKAISVDEALSLLPALQEAGFVPYRSQWTDNSRFFPVYANDGGITATVWHGFVREVNGKHEIVAIEHWNEHMADFKARTGLTLVEVMECPHPLHATKKY